MKSSMQRRRASLGVLAGLGAAACLCVSSTHGEPVTTSSAPVSTAAADPVHDFDVFFGTWHVRHRKLKERLANSHEWIEFEGSQVMQPILGGAGNMTDNVFNMPDGTVQRGVTLRAFDAKSRKWSIWWLDGNDPTRIDVPVVGSFEGGTGAFYADDKLRNQPIRIRFLWLNVTPTTRQWEQAFSADGGRTWETNWIAHFTRTGALP